MCSLHVVKTISIHAPREGCDQYTWELYQYFYKFQSTHPARGATVPPIEPPLDPPISIHAPREGCDQIKVL